MGGGGLNCRACDVSREMSTVGGSIKKKKVGSGRVRRKKNKKNHQAQT